MDEKLANKTGEVKAFTELAYTFFGKNKKILGKPFDRTFALMFTRDLELLSNRINDFSNKNTYKRVIDLKTEKTTKKLISMSENYIGSSWDDPLELCEWLGFFAGAAIVHWNLVKGLSIRLGENELSSICDQGIKINNYFFLKLSSGIRDL